MTSAELICDLRIIGPQDLCVVLQYLADYLYEARLRDGSRLVDISDFKLWLEELSAEAKKCQSIR